MIAINPVVAKARQAIGLDPVVAADPLADEWRGMDRQEREFWLRASRLSRSLAGVDVWRDLPGDVRTVLRNNLYRAARRASMLLGLSS